jgi:hypothetical protein
MTTALEGVRGQRHAPAPLYPGKDPVPNVQEAGWVSGSVWTGSENLAPTGIRSLSHPARSQTLYRLRYPAHTFESDEKILIRMSEKRDELED